MNCKPIAAALASSFVLASAQAAVVLMDFESGIPTGNLVFNASRNYFYNDNFADFTYQGFRVSPRCHVDWLSPGFVTGATGNSLGYDFGGCSFNGVFTRADGTRIFDGRNPADYLGNGLAGGQGMVYIDLAGARFDFLSFSTADLGDQATFFSSNGGSFRTPLTPIGYTGPDWRNFTLSGPEWTNVSWIIIGGGGGGRPSSPVDNLRFNVPSASSVPEPSSLSLLALATIALGWRRLASKSDRSV